MSFRIRLVPAFVAASLAAAAGAYAASPFGDNLYGANARLHEVLQGNPYFKGVPNPKATLCRVSHQGRPLAIFDHGPLAPGVLGTVFADFTKFDLATGKLKAEPHLQSSTFGGIVPLRGATAAARDFSYSGDSMFPLMTGKSWKMSLNYADSRLEYSCQDRAAPASFKIDGVSDDRLHLVSCERRTVKSNVNRPGFRGGPLV